jgi:hypothetical protein
VTLDNDDAESHLQSKRHPRCHGWGEGINGSSQ